MNKDCIEVIVKAKSLGFIPRSDLPKLRMFLGLPKEIANDNSYKDIARYVRSDVNKSTIEIINFIDEILISNSLKRELEK